MKRFRGQISCIFQTDLKGTAIDLFYDSTNMHAINYVDENSASNA